MPIRAVSSSIRIPPIGVLKYLECFFRRGYRLIISDEITAYLEGLVPERETSITEIEKFAREQGVPIMDLIGMEAMLQFLRIIQPNSILEIGTAIGYSAIRMAKALPNTQIITIERDPQRYQKAIEHINSQELQNQINVLIGDALEVVEQVSEYHPFDCIFIDAAKGQYLRFFELYSPFLSDNGVIFSDNVLFRGLVAKDHVEEKRYQNMVDKIKSYNKWVINHPQFDTTILTVGDGIAISRKR